MKSPKNIAGSLDLSFGDAGKVVFDHPAGLTRLTRDQTLITVGSRRNPGGLVPKSTLPMPPGPPKNAPSEFYLVEAVKHDAAGHNPKEQVLNQADANPRIVSLAVQTDGKYLMLWEVRLPGVNNMAFITRFHDDGTTDINFNPGFGSAPLNVPLADNLLGKQGFKVREGDGAVFAAFATTHADSVIIKLHSNGLRDTAFGDDGQVNLHNTVLHDLAFPHNGGLLVAGHNGGHAIIARYTDAGLPDHPFGQAGVVELALEQDGRIRSVFSIAVDTHNKITVVGSDAQPRHIHNFIASFTADGHLDPSFHQGVPVQTGVEDGSYVSHVVQQDGKIVVLAREQSTGFTTKLVRYNHEGHKDNSFGNAGVALAYTRSSGPGQAHVSTVELQHPGEKFLVSGPNANYYTYITRLLNDT